MALEESYWPKSLPTLALLNGFNPGIASNIVRTSVDSGAARQRSGGDIVIEPLTFSYSMTEDQLYVFREFCHAIGGRSFWMVFPNPNDPRYQGGKLRYFRIKGGQEVVSEPQAEGGGYYTVTVTFEFWTQWPGKDNV